MQSDAALSTSCKKILLLLMARGMISITIYGRVTVPRSGQESRHTGPDASEPVLYRSAESTAFMGLIASADCQ